VRPRPWQARAAAAWPPPLQGWAANAPAQRPAGARRAWRKQSPEQPPPAPVRNRPMAPQVPRPDGRGPAATVGPGLPPPARAVRVLPAPGAEWGAQVHRASAPRMRFRGLYPRARSGAAGRPRPAPARRREAAPGEDRCSRSYRPAMGGAQDIRAPPVHSAAFRARWLSGFGCYYFDSCLRISIGRQSPILPDRRHTSDMAISLCANSRARD